MWTVSIRAGWAELFTLASLAAVAALLTVAFRADWTIALVPGLTYALAIGVTYALYRRYAVGRPQILERPAAAVAFRVVDARGVCPLGRRQGDLVTVDPAGAVAPQVCPQAEAVLRMAAADGRLGVEEWCCPIFDHMLVFRREVKAA